MHTRKHMADGVHERHACLHVRVRVRVYASAGNRDDEGAGPCDHTRACKVPGKLAYVCVHACACMWLCTYVCLQWYVCR